MRKFIVLFVRTEQNQKILYKKFVSKIMVKSISLNQKSYLINYERPLFIDKNLNRIYVIDVFTGNQMIPEESKSELNPNDLDTVVSGKFIREFVSSVGEEFKLKLVWFILGCIIGFLGGALLLALIMQQQINELTKSLTPEIVPMAKMALRWLL